MVRCLPPLLRAFGVMGVDPRGWRVARRHCTSARKRVPARATPVRVPPPPTFPAPWTTIAPLVSMLNGLGGLGISRDAPLECVLALGHTGPPQDRKARLMYKCVTTRPPEAGAGILNPETTTPSSKVNLPHAFDFRALCGVPKPQTPNRKL